MTQNGATCENVPGSYRCHCAPDHYGIHCTENSNDCSAGTNEELCGHGTCVNQGNGYKCMCEQVTNSTLSMVYKGQSIWDTR